MFQTFLKPHLRVHAAHSRLSAPFPPQGGRGGWAMACVLLYMDQFSHAPLTPSRLYSQALFIALPSLLDFLQPGSQDNFLAAWHRERHCNSQRSQPCVRQGSRLGCWPLG